MSGFSDAAIARRHEQKPDLRIHDPELPINAHRDAIIEALKQHRVLVVAGETGSGKTTQLPRFALAAGYGRTGMIGHTQPRRIAARSVAARIAEEAALPLGQGVGYAIRFDDKSSDQTLVRLMTDGVLLNEVQRDRTLRRYDVVIIDEAHERSLNIDCLLGLLKGAIERRPDLRVIVTSATIDVERFSRFFSNAPIIEVSGRGYPVKVEYAAITVARDDSRRLARQVVDGVARLIDEPLPKHAKDILVFLPGEREIRDAERALSKSGLLGRGYEVVPLFGRLSDKDQQLVFKPSRQRRVVLATNVAETSITVPRIGAVLDTGLARINRYSPRARVTQLQLEPVSQASANQRSGRCGRIGPGVCVRLYSEDSFAERAEFTDPEMLRTNLSSVVLLIASLGIHPVADFPFPDPPEPGRLDDALRELRELRALDDRERITKLGRRLARLPLDPRLGAMLIAAKPGAVIGAVLVIVTGLSIQDPRLRPVEAASAADQAHEVFADNESDFLSLLKLWDASRAVRQKGRGHWERWCEANFLSSRRLREWQEMARQIGKIVNVRWDSEFGGVVQDKSFRADVHYALLTGLLTRVGHVRDRGNYEGVSGREFNLHKASVLSGKSPKWVMALEVVRTHKAMARIAASVTPGAVASAATHLTRYEYSDPYWNARKGRVEAKRTTLLGKLVLIANRRVPFEPVDRNAARKVFIREALIGDRLGGTFDFAEFNRREREALAELEGQLRRALEVRTSAIFEIFDRHLPKTVVSRGTLSDWLKRDSENDAKLRIDREQLLAENTQPDVVATPPVAAVRGNTLPLTYRFAPDRERDGATLTVPVGLLGALTPRDVEQAVPQFLQQRVAARLRALPKRDRKRLHPIASTAEALVLTLSVLPDSALALNDRLAGVLLREYGIQVENSVWSALVESDYWFPRLSIVDDDGQEIAAGRDLQALRRHCQPEKRANVEAQPESIRPVTPTDFPTLEPSYAKRRGNVQVTVFPALSVQPSGIVVHEFLDPISASDAQTRAVSELLKRRFKDQVKSLRKDLFGNRETLLLWAVFDDSGGAALADDLVDASLRAAFGQNFDLIRDAEAWQSLVEQGAAKIMPEGQALLRILPEILSRFADCTKRRRGTVDAFAEARDDVRSQIDALVFPGFLMATPVRTISELARYIAGAELRLERIAGNPARDNESMAMVHSLEARRRALTAFTGLSQRRAAEEFRWLIEELRVSLFAQSLGTREKVSLRRLEKRWDEILRMPE
ncbi:MAG: ATP-dependent RNA helicase HrpA [Pseudomonadota bacterium]